MKTPRVVFHLAAFAICVLAPFVGSTSINLYSAFNFEIPFSDNIDAQILFIARIPRVIAGALVGAALATSGEVLQALLRNPLATPFTLGVSAGGSLGAILVIVLGFSVSSPFVPTVALASFIGSLTAVSIVYYLARFRGNRLSTNVLLLAGVTLNSLFSATIMFVQYMADYTQSFYSIRWLMGNLDVSGYTPIISALPLLLVAFAVFCYLPRALNVLTLGADSASARGVNVLATQRLAFFSASLATGAAVAIGGPIGFIGIIIPHAVRMFVGADHRVVLPISASLGAAFLVICDIGARTILSPVELPVGVITAMFGGPFFLWILVRNQQN